MVIIGDQVILVVITGIWYRVFIVYTSNYKSVNPDVPCPSFSPKPFDQS